MMLLKRMVETQPFSVYFHPFHSAYKYSEKSVDGVVVTGPGMMVGAYKSTELRHHPIFNMIFATLTI